MTTETPAPPQPPSRANNVKFVFYAKVFQAPGACFVLRGQPKEPMYAVEMSGALGYVTLANLRKTFNIPPGSPDDLMIDKAAAGLHYVPDIRPGDDIPSEILDGTASWTVARRHKAIAKNKIQMQLLSWMTGKDMATIGQEELKAFLEIDENKTALRDSFSKAAVAMGLEAEQSEVVVDHIESLARELCYIEALRERSQELDKISKGLEKLTQVYSDDQKVSGDIGRMKILMAMGLEENQKILNDIDGETSDVLAALMTLDGLVNKIRKARDDLHYQLMEWDQIIEKWQKLEMMRGQPVDRALSTLYQFLAKRFSTAKSVMSRKSGDANKPVTPGKSVMTRKPQDENAKPAPGKSVLTRKMQDEITTPAPGKSLLKPSPKKPVKP